MGIWGARDNKKSVGREREICWPTNLLEQGKGVPSAWPTRVTPAGLTVGTVSGGVGAPQRLLTIVAASEVPAPLIT